MGEAIEPNEAAQSNLRFNQSGDFQMDGKAVFPGLEIATINPSALVI